MAKIHTSMPDDLFAKLNAACDEFGLERSRLIHRGIRLAIDEVTRQRAPAAAEPAPPAAPDPTPAPTATVEPTEREPFDIATVRRGDGFWFRLDQLIEVLGVRHGALMQEIDETDDVLEYAGQRWIDFRGLAEARTLCRDPNLGDRVQAWADAKSLSLQPIVA